MYRLRELEIIDSLGTFRLNYIDQSLTFYKNARENEERDAMFEIQDGEILQYAITRKEPLKLELENLISYVLGEATNTGASGEDGVRALELARSILKAAGREEDY